MAKHWTVYEYKEGGPQWPFTTPEGAEKYVADKIHRYEPKRVILFEKTSRGLEVRDEGTIYVIKEEN